MNIQTIIKGAGILTFLMLSANAMATSHPACQPIVQACKTAGFIKGGATGHRLYKDCVKAILMHQTPIAGGLALPLVDPAQVASCSAQRSGTSMQQPQQ